MSLAEKVIAGDVRAAARLISRLEDGHTDAAAEIDNLYPHTGQAYIVGVTGAPGAGKSTLIDNLIALLRRQNKTVGVIAIDPTSALTGGALLGDRIRMQRHSADPGVFIRSLATRGWVGGLAGAAIGAIHVMDALGRDIIIVETVGSGQVEIDIVRATDTTIVVLNPGAGDDVQMMKAGILESADILVVNKADLEGADRLRTGLESMLAMKERKPGDWAPPVVMTEAVNDRGSAELTETIKKHREYLFAGGGIESRRRARVRLEMLETVEGMIRGHIHGLEGGSYLENLVGEVLKGRKGLRRAAMEIAAKFSIEVDKSSKNVQ